MTVSGEVQRKWDNEALSWAVFHFPLHAICTLPCVTLWYI